MKQFKIMIENESGDTRELETTDYILIAKGDEPNEYSQIVESRGEFLISMFENDVIGERVLTKIISNQASLKGSD